MTAGATAGGSNLKKKVEGLNVERNLWRNFRCLGLLFSEKRTRRYEGGSPLGT